MNVANRIFLPISKTAMRRTRLHAMLARTAILASLSSYYYRPPVVHGFTAAAFSGGKWCSSYLLPCCSQHPPQPPMAVSQHDKFAKTRTTFRLLQPSTFTTTTSRRWMQSDHTGGGGNEVTTTWTNIGREEMEEIIEDVENGGREESGYVVMDVRNSDELARTGTLGQNTYHLPLPLIAEKNVFTLDEDEFFDVCGFEKPSMEETLVFSCAAGIRSVYAAQFAGIAGYTKLVNYMGGANEWFRRG